MRPELQGTSLDRRRKEYWDRIKRGLPTSSFVPPSAATTFLAGRDRFSCVFSRFSELRGLDSTISSLHPAPVSV
ncbi:hypothetical protein BD311DRAFT_166321 [Dichomitus squalens]|uniref:Uncharacterized protein n=1 Tax=Dichomitus squalens TaxID=114155 RepID=A0A4Q9M6Y5_9APHY|nr:hypothetical protein BD311DRAFT_166321 [Dichomitus squalens]